MESDDFKQWMANVDAAVENTVGMSVYDLPDCCFRDWFDARLTPAAAARRAIRNAKE